MATTVLRTRELLKPRSRPVLRSSRVYATTWREERPESGKRFLYRCLGAVAGALAACGSFVYFLDHSVKAFDLVVHPPSYPWEFKRAFRSLNHATLRRGWQVYKQICSQCHSLKYITYKDLVNVTHTEAEVKAIAAEAQVQDGPDEEGNYYMRPCKLSDPIASPYPNEEAARAANNGAYPPDLCLIINGRRNGANYLFSLFTGYMDPPAGVELQEGQQFNPYFLGGRLAMAPLIEDGAVDYDDGTKPTRSQIAKDVVEFLQWTAEMEYDTRKVMLIKLTILGMVLIPLFAHIKRQRWMTLKSKKICYVPK